MFVFKLCDELFHHIGYVWRISAFKITFVVSKSSEQEVYRDFDWFHALWNVNSCKLSCRVYFSLYGSIHWTHNRVNQYKGNKWSSMMFIYHWVDPWPHQLVRVMYVILGDVIMGAIASQITSLTIVYSTVYSDAGQRKHQSSASLAF